VRRVAAAVFSLFALAGCASVEPGRYEWYWGFIPVRNFINDPLFAEPAPHYGSREHDNPWIRTFPDSPVFVEERFYGPVLPFWWDTEPRLMRLRGIYTYQPDGGGYVDCNTDRRYPVWAKEKNATLEHNIRKVGITPGTAVHLVFDGRIYKRARPDGKGVEEVITVENFDSILPGTDCAVARTDAPIATVLR
jgi:hypothetical protein